MLIFLVTAYLCIFAGVGVVLSVCAVNEMIVPKLIFIAGI